MFPESSLLKCAMAQSPSASCSQSLGRSASLKTNSQVGRSLLSSGSRCRFFPLETAFKHTLHNFFLLSFCCLLTGTIKINLFYHKNFFV